MSTIAVIFCAILFMALAFLLVVVLPVGFGRLILRWPTARCKYIISHALPDIVTSVVVSLVLTGLALLLGLVFKQQWAFSGGLLLIYTFWMAIKAVRNHIRDSKRLR